MPDEEARKRRIERERLMQRLPQPPPPPWEGGVSSWRAVTRWGILCEGVLEAPDVAEANANGSQPRHCTSPNSAVVAAGARHQCLKNKRIGDRDPWLFAGHCLSVGAKAQNARGMDHSQWQCRVFGLASVTTHSQKRMWHGVALEEGFQEVHPATSVAHHLEVMHC